jgi:hypothetical protein
MPRSAEETPLALLEWSTVITKLELLETTTAGVDRLRLCFKAFRIARVLQRHPWRNDDERRQGFALADRAIDVSNRCVVSAGPEHQA